MKRERNELVEFLLGAAMLTAGLYLFCSKVTVSMGFFGGMFHIGGVSVASGLTVIPVIFGVVLIFLYPDAFIGKLVTGLGFVIIIAAVIASTRLYLPRISLFEWIIYLVLIFGGAALLIRVLFTEPKNKDRDE
ncbi:MAG: hypothetical protein ACI4AQ_00070 [Lachnospiraceae bacterium]